MPGYEEMLHIQAQDARRECTGIVQFGKPWHRMRQRRIVGVSAVAKFLSVLVQGQPPNSLRSHQCVPSSPAFAARLRRDQRGATAVEYGIMVSLIAVVIIVAVTLLGGTLKDTFNQVQCTVKGGAYTRGQHHGRRHGRRGKCSK